MDLAASIQVVTEDIMVRMASHSQRVTGAKNLVLAGGVALNCVGNGRILREKIFENMWIQPAAGDAGGALGAALFTWHQLLNHPRTLGPIDSQRGSLLGPHFADDTVKQRLNRLGAKFQVFESEADLCQAVADLIAKEKVVGHMHGPAEFGPRALGNRSIIGDARSPAMQSVMNLKIKFRESFRPFAPCVLKEHVADYFQMDEGYDSPYMLVVAPVRERHRRPPGAGEGKGLDKLKAPRSTIPAVTHVDYSARVQTVDAVRHPRLHGIMSAFHEKTGCPVIINTSFNVRGEPIVNTPEDAFRCFMGTNIDALVVENTLLLKEDQVVDPLNQKDYLSKFELD
jgi:carbamoyltransferase